MYPKIKFTAKIGLSYAFSIMTISHEFVPSHQIRALLNRVKIVSVQLLHVCQLQKSFVEGS